MSYTYWKVKDEDKYFKKVSDSEWHEFHNGRHVFSFEFMRSSGDKVFLKKKGWLMYLQLDSSKIIYGESPYDLDKFLYSGGWSSSGGGFFSWFSSNKGKLLKLMHIFSCQSNRLFSIK